MSASPHSEPFLDCIHCGYCLPTCPSYAVLGTEMDSPRGRIYLMRAVSDGSLPPTATYAKHIDTCLLCKACETACPSAVPFGAMMEEARIALEKGRRHPIRRVMMGVLREPQLLRSAAAVIRFAQQTGVTGIYERVFNPRRFSSTLLPLLPASSVRKSYDVDLLPPHGIRTHRVGFLRGCAADVLFSEVNRATIDVLRHNGCEVVMPRQQSCCGALHSHNGMHDEAQELARRNIDAFLNANVDVVITNAAGCGAAMKSYASLLPHDSRAREYSGKVKDIMEFLAEIELAPFTHRLEVRVAYHDPCHLSHGQGIRRQPRDILNRIPGLQLVELDDGELCCGSAGIYNILQPEIATALQTRKRDYIVDSNASIVVAGNPGCLLQIAAGLRNAGSNIETVHPIALVARAYGIPHSVGRDENQ
jgi:glycolate oxidase iron-sulfur subunit